MFSWAWANTHRRQWLTETTGNWVTTQTTTNPSHALVMRKNWHDEQVRNQQCLRLTDVFQSLNHWRVVNIAKSLEYSLFCISSGFKLQLQPGVRCMSAMNHKRGRSTMTWRLIMPPAPRRQCCRSSTHPSNVSSPGISRDLHLDMITQWGWDTACCIGDINSVPWSVSGESKWLQRPPQWNGSQKMLKITKS